MPPVSGREFTDAELDSALDDLANPERVREATAVVERAAPKLHQILAEALKDGGWFDETRESVVARATGTADEVERLVAVRTLLAEETRLGMMVGVAVGYELARSLQEHDDGED
jgi:hypothetical protein